MKRITFDIAHALESLYPEGRKFMQEGLDYSGLTWTDGSRPKPSEAELNSEIIRLQEEYDSQEYARNREESYPSTGDQLDYIYHNGVAKWKTDMIDPVKTKYPKG